MTETWLERGRDLVSLHVGQALAQHQPASDLGQRHPIALETNGTVREARGLASITYSSLVAVDGELDVDQPDDAQPSGIALNRSLDLGEHCRRATWRDHAGRVAGMDSGLLDVLHDRADPRR